MMRWHPSNSKRVLAATFVLACLAHAALSDDSDYNQDSAAKHAIDLFGSSHPADDMKSGLDVIYLTQSHKKECNYLRTAVTVINARGFSTELWLEKKEMEMRAIFESSWESYIIFNDGAEIVEYRRYAPSYFTIISARAGHNILGTEKLDEYLDRKGAELSKEGNRLRSSSSILESATGFVLRGVGVSASAIGDLLGTKYEGEEAQRKIQEGGVNIMTEPAMFSNRHYLIHYRMGSQYPDKATPVVLEGDSFTVWSPLNARQEQQENARQSTILKSAYLIDQGLLPEGRPARRGEQWTVSAGIFSDAIGLRARRIQSHYGSVRLRRSDRDVEYNGQKTAELRLMSSAHNLIHVITEPTQIATGTHETMDIKFEPSYGQVLWSFDDQQIALIKLRGKAYIRMDQDIEYWPDTTSTLIPQFESTYLSIILAEHLDDTDEYKHLLTQLHALADVHLQQ